MSGGLSFPPLLSDSQWKGAVGGRQFPGGGHTWKKALAPRPLSVTPDEATVRDLQISAGPSFNALQQTINLPDELIRATATQGPAPLQPVLRVRTPQMPLYDKVWPGTTPPNFSVWEYTKKHGHAMPPNSLPAPRVNDMKQWFSTYGHPQELPQPGVRTEFTSLNKSIPRSKDGEKSKAVRMFRGSVLR
jgi:hypothetical protein